MGKMQRCSTNRLLWRISGIMTRGNDGSRCHLTEQHYNPKGMLLSVKLWWLNRIPGHPHGRILGFLERSSYITKKKLNSMVWVRERTIPTERPPLVGEVAPTSQKT
jgi:hypothetical protein